MLIEGHGITSVIVISVEIKLYSNSEIGLSKNAAGKSCVKRALRISTS